MCIFVSMWCNQRTKGLTSSQNHLFQAPSTLTSTAFPSGLLVSCVPACAPHSGRRKLWILLLSDITDGNLLFLQMRIEFSHTPTLYLWHLLRLFNCEEIFTRADYDRSKILDVTIHKLKDQCSKRKFSKTDYRSHAIIWEEFALQRSYFFHYAAFLLCTSVSYKLFYDFSGGHRAWRQDDLHLDIKLASNSDYLLQKPQDRKDEE